MVNEGGNVLAGGGVGRVCGMGDRSGGTTDEARGRIFGARELWERFAARVGSISAFEVECDLLVVKDQKLLGRCSDVVSEDVDWAMRCGFIF